MTWLYLCLIGGVIMHIVHQVLFERFDDLYQQDVDELADILKTLDIDGRATIQWRTVDGVITRIEENEFEFHDHGSDRTAMDLVLFGMVLGSALADLDPTESSMSLTPRRWLILFFNRAIPGTIIGTGVWVLLKLVGYLA